MNDARTNSLRGSVTTSEAGSPDQGLNSAEVVVGNEDEMPTLAAKLFIESVTEVELLKKFRLVNKFWNHEACHALRKLSITTLRDRDNDLKDLHSVLTSGAMTSLPSPFHHLSLRVDEDLTQDFFTPLHSFGLEIKSLHLYRYSSVDNHVKGLLKLSSKEICELNICSGTTAASVIENFSTVQLPSLQTLNVDSSESEGRRDNDELNYAGFVKTLQKQGSPITSLTLTIWTSSCFYSLLSLDLSGITNLDLHIAGKSDMPKECWDGLATLQWPALKMLRIEFRFRDDSLECLNHLHSVFHNVAPFLEYLSVNGNCKFGERNTNSTFPNLKTLEIIDLTPAEQIGITQEMFPCLEEVQFLEPDREGADEWLTSTHAVHEGVTKISLGMDGKVNQLNYNRDKASAWVEHLTKQFPNVRAVEIRMCTLKGFSSWTSLSLRKFYYAYPQLKSLKLDTHGRTPMFGIPHFQNLESLELGDGGFIGVELSDWSIQNIIVRFPKLKYLRFCWTPEVSVEKVRDSLQHLRVLEISNFYICRNILTQLRAAMPGTLVRARY